jgi:phosphatidylglycerophosphate synthase
MRAIVQESCVRHECIILADSPGALVELCGITLLERLLRTLQRCGLNRAIVLSATPNLLGQRLANPSPHRAKVALDMRGRASGTTTVAQLMKVWPNDTEEVLLLRGDSVFDSRLLQLLDARNSTTVLIDSAPSTELQALVAAAPETSRSRLCGAALLSWDWASAQATPLEEALGEDVKARRIEALDVASQPWYYALMRRELRPYWFPAPAPAQRKIAERVLLDAAQKGALDLPALVHAPLENFLVSHLCKTVITPNQLTIFANVVAWGATFFFATGHLGWGAILALAVGVLDGLDGKQARVKVETSKAGKLEHWFDALFENSWWIALAYHFQSAGELSGAFRYLLLLIGAEAVGGLAKWSIVRSCGRSLDELSGFDRIVRLVGGRRNVHVWILAVGLLLGVPAKAFVIIAFWETITAVIHLVRAGWTLLVRHGLKPHAEA